MIFSKIQTKFLCIAIIITLILPVVTYFPETVFAQNTLSNENIIVDSGFEGELECYEAATYINYPEKTETGKWFWHRNKLGKVTTENYTYGARFETPDGESDKVLRLEKGAVWNDALYQILPKTATSTGRYTIKFKAKAAEELSNGDSASVYVYMAFAGDNFNRTGRCIQKWLKSKNQPSDKIELTNEWQEYSLEYNIWDYDTWRKYDEAPENLYVSLRNLGTYDINNTSCATVDVLIDDFEVIPPESLKVESVSVSSVRPSDGAIDVLFNYEGIYEELITTENINISYSDGTKIDGVVLEKILSENQYVESYTSEIVDTKTIYTPVLKNKVKGVRIIYPDLEIAKESVTIKISNLVSRTPKLDNEGNLTDAYSPQMYIYSYGYGYDEDCAKSNFVRMNKEHSYTIPIEIPVVIEMNGGDFPLDSMPVDEGYVNVYFDEASNLEAIDIDDITFKDINNISFPALSIEKILSEDNYGLKIGYKSLGFGKTYCLCVDGVATTGAFTVEPLHKNSDGECYVTEKDRFYIDELKRGIYKEFPIEKNIGVSTTTGSKIWHGYLNETTQTPTAIVADDEDYSGVKNSFRITDINPDFDNGNNVIAGYHNSNMGTDYSDCESDAFVLRLTARQTGKTMPKYRIGVTVCGQTIFLNEDKEINHEWKTFEIKGQYGELLDSGSIYIAIKAIEGEDYQDAVLEIANISVARCSGNDVATIEIDEDTVIRNVPNDFHGYSMEFQSDDYHKMTLDKNGIPNFHSKVEPLRQNFKTNTFRIGGGSTNYSLWKCDIGPYIDRVPYKSAWEGILDTKYSPTQSVHMGLIEQLSLVNSMNKGNTHITYCINMISTIPQSVRDTITYSEDKSSYKFTSTYLEGNDSFGNPKKELFEQDLIVEYTEITQAPEDSSELVWMDQRWNTWEYQQQKKTDAILANPDTTHPYWIGTYGGIDEEALKLSINDTKDLVRFLTLNPDDEKACDATGFNWAQYRVNLGIIEPIKVEHWELGNEYTMYPIKGTDYVRLCKEYICAIREIDPEAKFIVQINEDSCSAGKQATIDWRKAVSEDDELISLIDGAVIHKYYNHEYMNLMSLKILEENIKFIENLGLKAYMTETGSDRFNGGRFKDGTKLGTAISYASWYNKLCKMPSLMQMNYHIAPGFDLYYWGDTAVDLNPYHYMFEEYTNYANGDVYQTYNTDDYMQMNQLTTSAFKTPWGMRLFISNYTGSKYDGIGNDLDAKTLNISAKNEYSVASYRSFGRNEDEESTEYENDTVICEDLIPLSDFEYFLCANEVLVLDLVRDGLGVFVENSDVFIKGLAPKNSQSVNLEILSSDNEIIKTLSAQTDTESVFEFEFSLEDTLQFPMGAYLLKVTDSFGNVIWQFNFTKTADKYMLVENRRDKMLVTDIPVVENGKEFTVSQIENKKVYNIKFSQNEETDAMFVYEDSDISMQNFSNIKETTFTKESSEKFSIYVWSDFPKMAPLLPKTDIN